jgi:hypothetical protein
VKPPQRKSPIIAEKRLNLPIPEPELIINKKELIAGELVVVQVKLPPYSGSIYVKLWVQDRQTRNLLDGPRALVDLDSNNVGELETITQMTVPFGSMEIRFEAIAIDSYTQQESRKVTLDRLVFSESVSDLPLDDLEEFEFS